MKKLIGLFLFIAMFSGCHKNNSTTNECNIQKIYTGNEKKVTIQHGIWGTVSSMEGNCMPMAPTSPSGCKNCPVKRIVKIFEYTMLNNATPAGYSNIFFDSFNTQLIAQIETDDNGFFQINIPNGHYSIAIVENGKLYANGTDGQGGLCAFELVSGIQKVNVTMTYKASF